MQAHILIAEDRSALARPLVTELQGRGYDVRLVPSVRDARAALAEGEYDLLILDVTLETDGLEFFQAIRFSPQHPRGGVIIMTEAGDVTTRERAQQLGAAAVMTKPIEPDRLAAVVNDLLAFV